MTEVRERISNLPLVNTITSDAGNQSNVFINRDSITMSLANRDKEYRVQHPKGE